MVMDDGKWLLNQGTAEDGLDVGLAGTEYIRSSLREVPNQVDSLAVLCDERP